MSMSFIASAQVIDYNDTLSLSNRKIMKGFSALDSVVPHKKLFIAGEDHTYRESNSKLWVQNIKYLYKHAGVRNVVMESGLSTSWLANEYVQTGDTAIFNIIEKYVYKEYAERYKQLYRFNRDLDSGEKVHIFGIDLERGSFGALKVLSLLLPDSRQPHDSIDLHIESIKGMAMYQDREVFDGDEDEGLSGYTYSVSSTLKLVIKNFRKQEYAYKAYLGSQYDLFERIIGGLEQTIKWRSLNYEDTPHGYVFREKYMYNSFVALLDSNPGKYYGQFGRCHATKKKADKNSCEWFVFKSLANRLKQDEALHLENDIVTFGIIYGEDDDYEDDDWQLVEDELMALFEQLDANRVMLFDIAKDSVLADFFADDFDYFFLNSYQPSEKTPYYEDIYDITDYEEESKVTLSYAYGLQELDLWPLAERHNPSNQEVFDNLIVWQGGNITFSAEGVASTSNLSFMSPIETTNTNGNNAVTTRLSGFSYNSYLFYDLLSNVKFMDFLLGGSIGYSQFNFKVEETTQNPGNISTGFLGTTKKSVYKNPGITGRLSAGLLFNIGRLTFGGEVGNSFDFSNTEWRLDGNTISEGPKTSFSGLYGTAHLGVNFDL